MHTSIETAGVIIGSVAGADATGSPLVSWSGGEPAAAQVVWLPAVPKWADCIGARVVLAFADGNESQPIILGLLDAPVSAPQREPDVLRIASGYELVIECGEAKIMLRADGRVEIRGKHLVSRSSGPNKIKGGAVHIN